MVRRLHLLCWTSSWKAADDPPAIKLVHYAICLPNRNSGIRQVCVGVYIPYLGVCTHCVTTQKLRMTRNGRRMQSCWSLHCQASLQAACSLGQHACTEYACVGTFSACGNTRTHLAKRKRATRFGKGLKVPYRCRRHAACMCICARPFFLILLYINY